MTMHIFLPFLAFLLDYFFKDPEKFPHPVQAIGWILDRMHSLAHKQHVVSFRFFGLLSLLITIIIVLCVCLLLINIHIIGIFLSLYLAYAGLSLGSLINKAWQIVNHVEQNDIETARTSLALLVSRDTNHLSSHEIYKTLAETVSENFNDGFVAPYFYLLLGGPLALWIFKAVSTMDSMWGYKIGYWKNLGWAGAKTDDLLNYIPSRLTAVLIILTGMFLGHSWKAALQNTIKEARSTESPNAGWPMAASAWCLQAPMGGKAIYFGQSKDKPPIGPQNQEWSLEKIQKLFRLITFAGWIWALGGQIILWTLLAVVS